MIISVQSRWGPAYYVNFFYLAGVLSTTVTIVHPQDNGQLLMLLSESAHPGFYGVALIANGGVFAPYLTANLSSTVRSLEVVQSAFSVPFQVGKLLDVMPIVRVLNVNSSGIENITVIIGLVATFPNGTTVVQDIFQNVEKIALGGVIQVIMTDSGLVIETAYSSKSNASGFTLFSNLALISVETRVNISFRYCSAFDVVYDVSLPLEIVSYCVDDPNSIMIGADEASVYALSSSSISGTPGQFLPDITVSGVLNNGNAVNVTFCAPMLNGADRNAAFSFSTAYGSVPGSYYAVGGQLLISNSIAIQSDFAEGVY